MKTFGLVVAIDQKNGIGAQGTLPWKLTKDMKYFRTITTETSDKNKINAVIMGRTTWDSIPLQYRPLSNRKNIILTRNTSFNTPSDAIKANTFEEALQLADSPNIEKCFVIGGGKVYAEAINHPLCEFLYVTEIESNFVCDAFFPEFREHFEKVDHSDLITENQLSYRFNTYQRRKN